MAPTIPELELHRSELAKYPVIRQTIDNNQGVPCLAPSDGVRVKHIRPIDRDKLSGIEPSPAFYEEKGYPLILPMKAQDYIHEKHKDWWTNPSTVVQMKHDGVRSLLCLRRGINRLFSGRIVKNGWLGDKTDRVPHLRDTQFPNEFRGTVLDGEVISPNGTTLSDFKYTSGTINSNPLKAVANQLEKGFLVFTVFDIVYYKGYYVGNLPYVTRMQFMNKVIYDKRNRLRSPYIVPTFSVGDNPVILGGEKLDRKDYYHYLFGLGVEGVMLKDTDNLPYQMDYRSYNVLKLKQSVDLDLVCVGFTPANEGKTGKFKDMVGAMRLGLYIKATDYDYSIHGEEIKTYEHLDGTVYKLEYIKTRVLIYVGKTSGMNDGERRDMTDNPEDYLNHVVKVKCNDVYKDTWYPRNPRYQVMHESKISRQCTMEEHKLQAQMLPMI